VEQYNPRNLPVTTRTLLFVEGPQRGEQITVSSEVERVKVECNFSYATRIAVYDVAHDGDFWYLTYRGWDDDPTWKAKFFRAPDAPLPKSVQVPQNFSREIRYLPKGEERNEPE